MPTYGLSAVAVALSLVAVFGVRGVAYAMGDPDWVMGCLMFGLGLFFTAGAAGGTFGTYTALISRHDPTWIVAAVAGTVIGSAIIFWRFHVAASRRDRPWTRCYYR